MMTWRMCNAVQCRLSQWPSYFPSTLTTFECIFLEWPSTTGATVSADGPFMAVGNGTLVFVAWLDDDAFAAAADAVDADADAAKSVEAVPRLRYLLVVFAAGGGGARSGARRRRSKRVAVRCMQQRAAQVRSSWCCTGRVCVCMRYGIQLVQRHRDRSRRSPALARPRPARAEREDERASCALSNHFVLISNDRDKKGMTLS